MREISNNLIHNKDNSKIPKQSYNSLQLYSKTISDKNSIKLFP